MKNIIREIRAATTDETWVTMWRRIDYSVRCKLYNLEGNLGISTPRREVENKLKEVS